MSHQSGIKANEELRRFFASCKNGQTRLVKVSIKSGKDGVACAEDSEEQLVLAEHRPVRDSFEQDYKALVVRLVEEHVPCYILMRLDSMTQTTGYDWLLISYSPDSASVRQKMVYAATRSTLKTEFGGGNIKEEFHAAAKDEVSFESYLRFKHNKATPGPMTDVEQELSSLNISQRANHTGSTIASQTMCGIAFPIDQIACDKLKMLRDDMINYVQLSVDVLNEAIKLERFDNITISQLMHQIPRNHPRYHFYVFKHHFKDEFYKSIVFLYSMPSQGCSIKEKMLYSSCKNSFLDTVKQYLGVNVDRKIEMDATDNISEQGLIEELHPMVYSKQAQFARPQGPTNRGQRRIIRPVPN